MIVVKPNASRRLWAISGHYDAYVHAACRGTPGMQWVPAMKAWVGYPDAAATVIQRARASGVQIQGDVTTPALMTPSAFAPAYEGLRSHQKSGVDFLLSAAEDGVLLTDETGTGKSAQAIRTLRALKSRAVVVCLSFGRLGWVDEIHRWWPHAAVKLLSTTKATPIAEDVDVVVIHYDILYAWADALLAWGPKAIVFDEIHELMGATSRRTSAAMKLAHACRWRIGLTATPMQSRPRDLWAPVEVLSPGRFGKPFSFFLRYCDARKEQVTPTKAVWKTDGASNLDELNRRLAFFSLRRTKADLRLDLPAFERKIVEVEVKRAKSTPADLLKTLTNDRALRAALDAAGDQKLQAVADMATRYVNDGHKVVIFSYRKAIAESLATTLKQRFQKTAVVTGDVPHAKRRDIIAQHPDVLCATFDSAGTGISLAHADVAIAAELHYVPSTLIQAEGRLPRPDSKSSHVTFVYVCARGTADDVIRRIILRKLGNEALAIGAGSDKLLSDLEDKRTNVEKLRSLYSRLLQKEKDDDSP